MLKWLYLRWLNAENVEWETGGKPCPRERAAIAVTLVLLVGIVEVVSCFAVYNIWSACLPIALGGGGILGLVVIDLWIRPRSEEQGARYVRRFLPLWSLVPFLCALGASVWVHIQAREQGLRDIREVAHEVAIALASEPVQPSAGDGKGATGQTSTRQTSKLLPAELQLTTGKVEAVVKAICDQRFPGAHKETQEAEKFYALARIIGHDLKRAKGDPEIVFRRARTATMLDFCIMLAAQALFVLWIPCLLMISLARANHNLEKHGGSKRGSSEGQTADPQLPAATIVRGARDPRKARDRGNALDLRDQRILAEDRRFFVPRLCFGTLLVLGTTYLFAPFGIKASCIMSLVSAHALPGQTSFALWSSNFDAVPVMVVGFVGFLIYALITATQRFAQADLDDYGVFALLVRGLVVVLLSLVLSSSPVSDGISRLFVFIAGVFPLRALEAIAKRANITLDPELPSDGPGSFEGIPNLDAAKVFALRAAGVQSTYDLAAMPVKEIIRRVRIDPRVLGRAVDRAILIDAIGLDLQKELAQHGITSATELVALQPSMPPCLTDKLGDAAKRAANRLASDDRVTSIRDWLDREQRRPGDSAAQG
jgi:uncharacterized protein YhhL (DUF1145 family)